MNRNYRLTIRLWLLLLGVAAVVITIDQFTKQIILDRVPLNDSVAVLPPYFSITHSTNTGAAFGFGAGAGDIFLIIAVVVVIGMLIFYPRLPLPAFWLRVGMGLIAGGALGNALDRLQHGHVIDFIHYQIPGLLSNVSNLADHAIVLGVIIVFLDSWFGATARQAREHRSAERHSAATSSAEHHNLAETSSTKRLDTPPGDQQV